MTGALISYPTGWTLAVLDDPSKADAAAVELRADDVAADDLIVMAGDGAAAGIERLGAGSGATHPCAGRCAASG